MIKVTVPQGELRHMQGNAKASGKPYSLFFQTVYLHTLGKDGKPHQFPEKAEIIVEKNDHGQGLAYGPGEYQLHPASVYVDRSGDVKVAPKLIPLVR